MLLSLRNFRNILACEIETETVNGEKRHDVSGQGEYKK